MESSAQESTGEVALPPETQRQRRASGSGVRDVPREPVPPFETIYQSLSPYIWRALRRLGVAERDVDDVVQEVFLVVHRKLPTFERRSSVRSFVYGIALRLASDYRKRAYQRRERVSDSPPERQTGPNQLEAAEQRQSRELLDRLLSALDEKKLSVFVLYEIEQISMAEVADAVGCTPATAYARLSAARKQLKRTLLRKQATGELGDTFDSRGEPRRASE